MKDEFEDGSDDIEISWNKREQKSPVFQYVLLAILCLILAYLLSGTAK